MSRKPTPERDQVMQWVATQDDLAWDFQVPNDVMTKAIAQGLAAEFSFFIRYTPAERNPFGDDAPYFYAVIYPNGLDSTWKGPAFIRPMLPESHGDDECMETEWHFDAERFATPGAIAALLATRGFAFDAEGQKWYADEATIFDQVNDAVRQAKTPPAAPAKSAPRPPKR